MSNRLKRMWRNLPQLITGVVLGVAAYACLQFTFDVHHHMSQTEHVERLLAFAGFVYFGFHSTAYLTCGIK